LMNCGADIMGPRKAERSLGMISHFRFFSPRTDVPIDITK
jgi:hypothetical protein